MDDSKIEEVEENRLKPKFQEYLTPPGTISIDKMLVEVSGENGKYMMVSDRMSLSMHEDNRSYKGQRMREKFEKEQKDNDSLQSKITDAREKAYDIAYRLNDNRLLSAAMVDDNLGAGGDME